MALAVLILQDLPDGSVRVNASCEPALEPGGQPSKAQGAMIIALNALEQTNVPQPEADDGTGTPLDS